MIITNLFAVIVTTLVTNVTEVPYYRSIIIQFGTREDPQDKTVYRDVYQARQVVIAFEGRTFTNELSRVLQHTLREVWELPKPEPQWQKRSGTVEYPTPGEIVTNIITIDEWRYKQFKAIAPTNSLGSEFTIPLTNRVSYNETNQVRPPPEAFTTNGAPGSPGLPY